MKYIIAEDVEAGVTADNKIWIEIYSKNSESVNDGFTIVKHEWQYIDLSPEKAIKLLRELNIAYLLGRIIPESGI